MENGFTLCFNWVGCLYAVLSLIQHHMDYGFDLMSIEVFIGGLGFEHVIIDGGWSV